MTVLESLNKKMDFFHVQIREATLKLSGISKFLDGEELIINNKVQIVIVLKLKMI